VSGSEEASREKVTLWLLFACFLLLLKLRHTISLVSSERDEGSKVWQPFFMAKSGNFGKNVEKVVAQCSLKYYAEEAISVIMKHILK